MANMISTVRLKIVERSTKNADKMRDPDMHQTRKGQQWHFGMKLHIGVIKRLWGFNKVRYRGLQKNVTRAFTALALSNIFMSRAHLMAQVRP
jgi:IS5 family transposase